MPEKTVAAFKADKAKTVLFGKRRAEVPEHVRPEAVMLHVPGLKVARLGRLYRLR